MPSKRGGTGRAAGLQRGCRTNPGGAGAIAIPNAKAGARRTGRKTCLACPRWAAAGRIEERGRAAGKAAARGSGGACAVPLHGEALRQRKAPHGAGLVRGGICRGLFTGGGLKAAKPIEISGKPFKIMARQPPQQPASNPSGAFRLPRRFRKPRRFRPANFGHYRR